MHTSYRESQVIFTGIATPVEAAGIGTFGALVVAALAMKDRALEEWYLWQLDSEDEKTRLAAAETLATVGTERSLPKVVGKLDEIWRGPIGDVRQRGAC